MLCFYVCCSGGGGGRDGSLSPRRARSPVPRDTALSPTPSATQRARDVASPLRHVDLSSGHGVSVSLDGRGHSTTSLLGLPIFATLGGRQEKEKEDRGAVVAVLMLQVGGPSREKHSNKIRGCCNDCREGGFALILAGMVV